MMPLRGLLSAIVVLAHAQAGEPVRIEFCRLISAPAMYAGKLVQTTAIVRMGEGEQGIWLIDQKCSGTSRASNVPFLRAVVITADPETDEGRHVTIDEPSLAELQGVLLRPRKRGVDVIATLTGVFEARGVGQRLVGGQSRGFGHLGGFPFQLVFQGAKEIRTVTPAR